MLNLLRSCRHEVSGTVSETGSEIGSDFELGMDVVAYLPVDNTGSGLAEYEPIPLVPSLNSPAASSIWTCVTRS